MKVVIPGPLLSYTGKREVEASGATLGELLADLDRQCPGFRFRVVDEQDRLRQARPLVNEVPRPSASVAANTTARPFRAARRPLLATGSRSGTAN